MNVVEVVTGNISIHLGYAPITVKNMWECVWTCIVHVDPCPWSLWPMYTSHGDVPIACHGGNLQANASFFCSKRMPGKEVNSTAGKTVLAVEDPFLSELSMMSYKLLSNVLAEVVIVQKFQRVRMGQGSGTWRVHAFF